MKKIRKSIITVLLACSMCIGILPPANAEAGSDGKSMDVDELVFITLADNTAYRWNANGYGDKGNVIHLDTTKGINCKFKLKKVVNDKNEVAEGDKNYYGIKFIRDDGIDRFCDIEDKSKSDGKKLHLWESDDKKVKGNEHRQFVFYSAGQTNYGDPCYYIKARHSGKWLGVEDSNKNNKTDKGDKIIQTSESNRKKWIITKGVVPKCGNEDEKLIASGAKSAYIEIFKKDTDMAINRMFDAATKGTLLNIYDVGTSSKWRINWNSKYSAYTIQAITSGEKVRSSIFNDGEVVWDVPSEDSKGLHLWTSQSFSGNENTSQLWRFIKQSNGYYKIQNARNGSYVDILISTNGGVLNQTDSGENFAISVFADTKDPVNYAYATDWMDEIPDDVYLSSVNIPGTHDTGTASVWEDGVAQLSITSCQKLYYGEQLNVGARSFDIRCNATSDTASPSDVKIIHGFAIAQCSNRDDSDLTLQNIFDDSVRFLKEHSSETIVMMVKPDSGSKTGLTHAVTQFIKNNPSYVYKGEGIPSMCEARGKIVFIRRYEIDKNLYNPESDGVNPDWLGIDLSTWDNYKYSDYQYAVEIYNKDGVSVYVQDAFDKTALPDKRDIIEGTLKQTTGNNPNTNAPSIPQDAWIYNYTSTAGEGGIGIPLLETRLINSWLYKDSGKYIANKRLGMVILNFIDGPIAKKIIDTNFSGGNFFAKKSGMLNARYTVTKSTANGGEVRYDRPADKSVTSISIPNTVKINGKTYKVTSIAANAFAGNKKLEKIVIGNNVKKIGKRAFANCSKLKQVKLGKNVKEIGNLAFSKCKKIKEFIIKAKKLKNSKIGTNAFAGINKKVCFEVPKNKYEMFKKLKKLKKIIYAKLKKK